MKKVSLLTRIFKKVLMKSVSFMPASIRLNGMESIFDALNLSAYKNSLYLFIGVSMIRESVSSIPLQVYRIKGKDGDAEEVYDSEVSMLLERPNRLQTQKEFWKLSVAYYLLAGETFWYLERDSENQFPTQMVNMRPDAVEIMLSESKKEVVGYQYTDAGGNIIKLRIDQVLHIKNIDPLNPIRGVGVVYPARQRIVTEQEASRHQAMTFRTQGRPDVAIFTTTDLSEETAEDARKRWAKIYGGDDGSKAGFFGTDVKDLKVLTVNPKEMDFINSQNFLRDDILAALHVPKAMVTSDDVNLANSKTARINFMKEAVLPVLDVFLDVVNNKLLIGIDEAEFVTYENPVNEDREILLKEATELKKAGIISVNESRALMGYEEMEGGDVLAASTTPSFEVAAKNKRIKRLARLQLKKRPVLMAKFDAFDAIRKMFTIAKSGVPRERNSVFVTKEAKDAYIKAFNDDIDRKAKGFKDALDVYNNGLAQRIVKRQEEFGLNPDAQFDVAVEMRTARDIFLPIMRDLYTKTGRQTMDSIASGFTKASEQFYTMDEVLNALGLRAEFFIASMLNTDYNELKVIIAAGMQEGKGVQEIGRDIRKYFDDMSVARARTIARTETGRVVSMATNEAYGQSAVVTGKEWLTAEDDKVRDLAGTVNDHVGNAGVIVDKGGAFPNGEHYPGELTINCRCALAPAV